MNPTPTDLTTDEARVRRCWWCGSDPLYMGYHDREWGFPVTDDQRLFEKISLEGFQAGLSWITILRKRDAFRQAFCDFDFSDVVKFGKPEIKRLLQNEGIVRHRGKIESTINNARLAGELVAEFGSLASYFWGFEPGRRASLKKRSEVVGFSDDSTRLSKDLKRRGWSFVGPTTCYAFMQAMGMVNDHIHGCQSWKVIHEARNSFARPT